MLKFHRKSNKVFDELVVRSLNSSISFIDDAIENNEFSALKIIFGEDTIGKDIIGAEKLLEILKDLLKKHNSEKIFRPTTEEFRLLSMSMKDYCATIINDWLHP
jgi:CRISPR/Cas system CSM-associated protein Csm2 small subunit